jgi:hypothetical protein
LKNSCHLFVDEGKHFLGEDIEGIGDENDDIIEDRHVSHFY